MPVLPNAEFASTSHATDAETSFNENDNENVATITIPVGQEEHSASFDQYLMSIVFMPYSLRMVCLTNLFCWMAHVRFVKTKEKHFKFQSIMILIMVLHSLLLLFLFIQ